MSSGPDNNLKFFLLQVTNTIKKIETTKTVTNSSKTIKNIINNKNDNNHITSDAGDCSIQCLGCNRKFVGETSRLIKKRIYEHET